MKIFLFCFLSHILTLPSSSSPFRRALPPSFHQIKYSTTLKPKKLKKVKNDFFLLLVLSLTESQATRTTIRNDLNDLTIRQLLLEVGFSSDARSDGERGNKGHGSRESGKAAHRASSECSKEQVSFSECRLPLVPCTSRCDRLKFRSSLLVWSKTSTRPTFPFDVSSHIHFHKRN